MARGRKVKQAFNVYTFLCIYKTEHDGCSPTYEEIADHFGWSSTTSAYTHIERLERLGYVRLDDRRRITLGGSYEPPEGGRNFR